MLRGPVMFTPKREGKRRYYDFSATMAIGPMSAGTIFAKSVASPAGNSEFCTVQATGRIEAA